MVSAGQQDQIMQVLKVLVIRRHQDSLLTDRVRELDCVGFLQEPNVPRHEDVVCPALRSSFAKSGWAQSSSR